jgi:hypothetical protein
VKPIAEQVASVKKGSKILICGSRAARENDILPHINDVIDAVEPCLVIVGGSSGVDGTTEIRCGQLGKPVAVFPAAWGWHGNNAGPIRNGWMLRFGQPDYVIAFPGGKGTENMVMQAEKAGVPVIRIVLEESC